MNRNRCNLAALALLTPAAFLCPLSPAQSDEPSAGWTSFQNAGHSAIAQGELPLQWSPENNIAWTSKIEGYGQSTPIVDDSQIVVTSVSGPNREQFHLSAYALEDGEKLWQRDFENPTPKQNTPMTSRAAPTPVADEEGCIALFEDGLVVAVGRDGTTRWQRNLVEEYGPNTARHGLASSLEQDDKRVYVWIERSEAPYILALDKKSGQNVWKSDGAGATTWSSPRLVPTDDGSHLVCSASGKIIGVDPETGNKLWELTDIANNTSCSPVPAGKNRFLIGASEGRGEVAAGPTAASNGLIEIQKEDGRYRATYVWKAQKATSSFGSPIVAGDTAAIVNRAGVLYRLDLETGQRVTMKRVSSGSIWATPIVSGNLLYLFGYKGATSVINLDSGAEVAVNRLWQPAQQPAAFGGGPVLYAAAPAPPYLILRRGDALFAVKKDE